MLFWTEIWNNACLFTNSYLQHLSIELLLHGKSKKLKLFDFSVSFGPVCSCFAVVDILLFAINAYFSTHQVWCVICNYSWGNHVLFNLFVIVVDDVDLMMCISGHLADESTIPKILSPVGSGTYKSMWTFSQGFCMIVACKSLRLPSFQLLKQGMHDQISFPVSLSRPGHHILLCNNDFVSIMPWCPLELFRKFFLINNVVWLFSCLLRWYLNLELIWFFLS